MNGINRNVVFKPFSQLTNFRMFQVFLFPMLILFKPYRNLIQFVERELNTVWDYTTICFTWRWL